MAEKYRLPGYRLVLAEGSYESRSAAAIDCSRAHVGETAVVVATFYDHILVEDADELVVISGSWIDGDFEVEDVSREQNPSMGSRSDAAMHYMSQMEEAATHLVSGRSAEASQCLRWCEELARQGCCDWLLEDSVSRLGALSEKWPGGDEILSEAVGRGADLTVFGLPPLSEAAGRIELLRRRIGDNMHQIARLIEEIKDNGELAALKEDLAELTAALSEAKRATQWATHSSVSVFWELADRCIVNMAASVCAARS